MSAAISDGVRLTVLGAREIRDGDVLFVGIGVPSLSAMTAKRHHAANSVLIYESGAVDSDPSVPPLSTGSPSVVANTAMVTSCLGVFSMLQQGRFDLGMLSAAQVDRQGNLNSTVLGSYAKPKVRMVGSGGAHDIAVLAKEFIIMMPHDPRRFVQKVDFVTSPGRRPDKGERVARGHGPRCVLTPRARFNFEAGELTLEGIADGFTEEQAVEGIGWTVPRSARLRQMPPIEPGIAATAARILEVWGREAT